MGTQVELPGTPPFPGGTPTLRFLLIYIHLRVATEMQTLPGVSVRARPGLFLQLVIPDKSQTRSLVAFEDPPHSLTTVWCSAVL